MNIPTSNSAKLQVLRPGNPADLGFEPDLAEKFDAGIRSGLLRGLHAVLVVRSGEVVLERYFDGPDEAWGAPLGQVAFGPQTLHDLRSVTKSIVGLLYGIALDRGLVPPPEAPLLAQFPEYADLTADPRRAKLTIEHVLTMTMGTDWNEQVPYTDPTNSEIAMENAKDRIHFVLDRPMIADPGAQWRYSGGATALLGALIARGSGKSLPDFAREVLFGPLGISKFEWTAGQDGVHSAASGLRLCARDLALVGELIAASGRSGDRQVVSSAWLDASFRGATTTFDGLEYGRQWFLWTESAARPGAAPRRWIGGFGNGGQRLWMMPSAQLTTVIFSGNYNKMDSWVTPIRIWREIVLANFRGA